ncbi:MAG: helical backbone metal receptor [Myxococcota bacterium]|nr:helical backbone metal receptor [Myxococcota bacterium]
MMKKHFVAMFVGLVCTLLISKGAVSYPIKIVDSRGETVLLTQKPRRVVSLVPAVTETIYALGAGPSVVGVTYHNTFPSPVVRKKVVGGFFAPNVRVIRKLNPDLIFVAGFHDEVGRAFGNNAKRGKTCQIVNLNQRTLSEAFWTIEQLGRIFDRADAARTLVEKNKAEIGLIEKKVKKIRPDERKRVLRLMGRQQVMTPGDDSFQNEIISLAGGTPPKLGKQGHVVPVTLEEWRGFNPQVIYGCQGDEQIAATIAKKPGWRDVDAVKNSRVYYFPCELTCRASSRVSHLVSWLYATVYPKASSDPKSRVYKEGIFRSEPLELDLDYVKKASVYHSRIDDFTHKSLIVEFKTPQRIASTLEGARKGVSAVGNHYFPPQSWGAMHDSGLKGLKQRIGSAIAKHRKHFSFLYTGADMSSLSVVSKAYEKLQAYALVTAGVRGNAMMASKDIGDYYEPGTINIIMLTNAELSHRARTRAILTATEAKTAALFDLDVRSAYSGRFNPATGTGTDNVIAVSGSGYPIDNTGGHSKMGELIAQAVYEGVKKAVYKQNGIAPGRSVFHRLEERGIALFNVISAADCHKRVGAMHLATELEGLLLDPLYGSFIQAALAISDDYEAGLVEDIGFFKDWCQRIANRIAKRNLKKMRRLTKKTSLPQVLDLAINALLNGAHSRLLQQ